MGSWATYAGASPSLTAAMQSILGGEAVKADATVKQLSGMAEATKLSEEAKKLAQEREQAGLWQQNMPNLAAENAAAGAGVPVPVFNNFRQTMASGADPVGPQQWEQFAPTSKLSQAVQQATAIQLGTRGGVGDYANAAKTHFADIPEQQAKAARESTLAQAAQQALTGATPEARFQGAAVVHPELLKPEQNNQLSTIQWIAQQPGMTLEKALQLMHPSGVQVNTFPPMPAMQNGKPAIIVPSKDGTGYQTLPGVEPLQKPESLDQVIGGIAAESQKQAAAVQGALDREYANTPGMRGAKIEGPSKSQPGAYIIVGPDGKKYTWVPKQ